MTIYHAVIQTMTEAGTIPHGFLTVENGKINCVQSGDPDTVTEDDLDAKGSLLLPGFIDAHTNLGILEDGLDFEGDDCNECTDPFTPHLRAIDGVNPLDRCFSEALAAGVTTVRVIFDSLIADCKFLLQINDDSITLPYNQCI